MACQVITAVEGRHIMSSVYAQSPALASASPVASSMANWSLPLNSGRQRQLPAAGACRLDSGVVQGRRSFPVACSSMRPLTDSGGNVSEFADEEEFNQILSDAGDKMIVLDVSTTTCGPCKMIFPKLVEMSIKYPDVIFLKINGDKTNETRALMRKWGVRAVPNFRFFRNQELIHSHSGAKLDDLNAHFAKHYGAPLKVQRGVGRVDAFSVN